MNLQNTLLRRLRVALLCSFSIVALGACAEADDVANNAANSSTGQCEDLDGDGFDGKNDLCPDGEDCNDRNPSINPDETEVCGDGKDNDCDGLDEVCTTDCADNDSDNFRDEACGGTDCDDSNPDIKPRATEICGNDIDEDCSGADLECVATCTDADNDGFGAAGSTGCMGGDEVDCDDTDPDVHPGVTEICNNKDDNCNDQQDECALAGQVCADGTCRGGAGAECQNLDDCAGSTLTCDTSTNPGICKGTDGHPCTTPADCVTGLACENDMCSGDFCAVTVCDEAGLEHCNSDTARCVECPFWEMPAVADAACNLPEQCVPGGWCAENWDVRNSDVAGATTADIVAVSIALADCFRINKDIGEKKLCYAFWIFNAVSQTITESMLSDAYDDGKLDGLLGMGQTATDRDEALDDLWGFGLFNLQEMDWKADLVPGTAKEVCVWYQPGGFLGGEAIVVDRCENYAP